jgi:phosphate transport system protein
MSDKHLSSQFDADLNLVSSKVLEMGGLVESQIVNAMYALNNFDLDMCEQVITAEERLNKMEVDIDEECSNIIVTWRFRRPSRISNAPATKRKRSPSAPSV